MTQLLNRLRIWQKLTLVGLAFTIPLAVTTWFLLAEKRIKIDFSTAELAGDEYLRPCARLLEHTVRHHSLSRRAREGDEAARKQLSEVAGVIDRDLVDLDAVDQRLGDLLATGAASLRARQREGASPQNIRALWDRLRAGGLDAAHSDATHVQMIAAVRMLITHVGDTSKLILDPDLDTYYQMDALLLRAPEIVDRIASLAGATEDVVRRGSASAGERADLAAALALLRFHVDGIKSDAATTINEVPNFSKHTRVAGALGGPLADLDAAVVKLEDLVRGGVLAVETPSANSASIEEAEADAIAAAGRYWRVLLDEEDVMLGIRRDGDRGRQSFALWAVGAALLLSLVLTTLILRSITVPLRKAREVADQLSRGELPDKVEIGQATDETGMLLRAINDMLQFLDLRRTVHGLKESGSVIARMVNELEDHTNEQSQAAVRQASALHETQVTAQEIKQTSRLAAEKAASVLEVAERAEHISRDGEAAIEKSISGLTEIRAQAEEIAAKIGQLERHTQQIGVITQTVKDLADQSNMLALNAAIEAVRSGEHGKGFAVVAREIRSLADQSVQATSRVNEILDNVSSSIRTAVNIAATGRQRMEAGLGEIKASGDNLRELSSMVRDSSQSVRQIAAAVSQQDAGISQIFGALTDQTKLMEDAMRRVEAAKKMATTVREAGDRVSAVTGRFKA